MYSITKSWANIIKLADFGMVQGRDGAGGLDCSGPFYRYLAYMKESEPPNFAWTIVAPPAGRRCTILGEGIFNRNYAEFSTGVDSGFRAPVHAGLANGS